VRRAGWWAASLASVYAVFGVSLLVDRNRFFRGDTQNAYYGWLYELGQGVLHGRLPLIQPEHFTGGPNVVEGQMGIYDPLTMLFGIGATVAPNLLVYGTLLKFVVAAIGVTGTYLVARDHGVRPSLAAAAAAAPSLCSFALIYDDSRWFTGQLVAALLPWAWWQTRRCLRGANPLPALIAIWLLISVGYVYGTLYLGVVLAAIVVEAVSGVRRDPAALARVIGLGVFCCLAIAVVYLPGVLSLDATRRQVEFGGVGPLQLTGWDWILLGQPAGPRAGSGIQMPLSYLFWFLPLVLLADLATIRRHWRTLVALFVATGLFLAWSVGPYHLGPIRWPARILDAYTVVLAVLVVVLLQQLERRPSWRRLALVVGLTLGSWVVIVQQYGGSHVTQLLVTLALLAGLAAAWRFVTRRWVGGLLLVGSVLAGSFQVIAYQNLAVPTLTMPMELSTYSKLLGGAEGGILQIDARPAVVGKGRDIYTDERATELLAGSLWNLTDKPVVNTYTTTGFGGRPKKFCSDFLARTCPQLANWVMRTEPHTGLPWADLFSLSTLLVERGPETDSFTPGAGWHLARQSDVASTFVRDQRLPPPGGVSWTSPGVRVTAVRDSDLSTTFRVDAAPPGGGTVVLSRAAWPGYRIHGAEFARPLEDVFLTVRVTPDQVGHEVVVSYRPPKWRLQLVALLAAVGLMVAWPGVLLLRARGRSRSDRARPPAPATTED
jgi:hypothetical protein